VIESYVGQVELEQNLVTLLITAPATWVPTNADATPIGRIFSPTGPLALQPTVAFRQTGSITNATNASPIVITSAGHGLLTGQRVTITGVGGNTAANGTFTITKVDDNSFSLNGSTGNGAYTSGGTWNTTGLYKATVAATAANGFAAGLLYRMIFNFAVSSTSFARIQNFLVR